MRCSHTKKTLTKSFKHKISKNILSLKTLKMTINFFLLRCSHIEKLKPKTSKHQNFVKNSKSKTPKFTIKNIVYTKIKKQCH